MEKTYYREYSNWLGREMEFNVYGSEGKPVLTFPCQGGRFYDWEGFGMTVTLGEELERGKIQLFCADSLDWETVSDIYGDPAVRVRRQEAWFHYVVDELVPRIRDINPSGQDILVTGFSMGAYHAANCFFRRPDLFDGLLGLSGIYDTESMYGGYMDELVYLNDPCVSISNMPEDHPYIKMFNQRTIILCVGQGAWEEPLLAGTRRFERVLRSKGIRAWVDYWGFDVSHDWPWWKRQIRYFLPYVLHGKSNLDIYNINFM